MPRKIESLFLAGPAGRLEALLEEPDAGRHRHRAGVPSASAARRHHAQQSGLPRGEGLRRSGHVVMRFNYRGVNLSEGEYAHGEGELDDARIALDVLASRYPALPLTLAGFSFGSRIALRLGCAPRKSRAAPRHCRGFSDSL